MITERVWRIAVKLNGQYLCHDRHGDVEDFWVVDVHDPFVLRFATLAEAEQYARRYPGYTLELVECT